MMKKFIALFSSIKIKKTASNQADLIEFMKDTENVSKAAEGSMQKRLDLIERVKLKSKNA